MKLEFANDRLRLKQVSKSHTKLQKLFSELEAPTSTVCIKMSDYYVFNNNLSFTIICFREFQ
jgi:hypothetical protein